MAKIKIIELLKSLSPDELKLLDKFVKSPVHNNHDLVTKLFAYLRKNIDKPSDQIYGEKLFKFLFPGSPIEMQKLHHVSSYLFKTVEEFLAWQEWKKDKITQEVELLKAYKRLKQPQFFHKTYNRVHSEFLMSEVKDDQYFEQKFLLEEIKFSQMRTNANNKDFRLQELSDAQDEAFIIQKLKTACILLSNQAVVKTTYNLGVATLLQQYCEESEYLQNPTLAIYFYASKALTDFQDDIAFKHLKNLLIEYRQRFNTPELYDIHIFAINYCIRRLNNGEQQFMREIFEIYQSGIESGIFIEKGMLAPRTYSNIVLSGLRLGEYDAVESFIFDYKDKLPEKQREGFFNYNLAHLYYEKGNYKMAMPLLLQMETHDVFHTCTSKTLLAKMYYELSELDSLVNLLQSFKIYLKRKHVLGYHRDLYLNFISFLNKLINAAEINEFTDLINIIQGTAVLAEKEWLIKQLEKSKT